MTTVDQFVARLPAWTRAVVAVACVAAGAVLTVRPFTSAGVLVTLAGAVAIVTGAATLVSGDDGPAAYRWLTGTGWIILGAVVLALPGLSVQALAAVVGVALIVTGGRSRRAVDREARRRLRP